jgi:hypothetical protein
MLTDWLIGVADSLTAMIDCIVALETTDELFDEIKHKEIEWEIYRDELSPDALSLLQGLLTKDVSKRLGCGRNGLADVCAGEKQNRQ